MSIDKEQALYVARKDAIVVYQNLDIYEVFIENKNGNWKIDYELKAKQSQGGGPHYIISGETGEILSKRYEQ